jgi:hypothetical protein
MIIPGTPQVSLPLASLLVEITADLALDPEVFSALGRPEE